MSILILTSLAPIFLSFVKDLRFTNWQNLDKISKKIPSFLLFDGLSSPITHDSLIPCHDHLICSAWPSMSTGWIISLGRPRSSHFGSSDYVSFRLISTFWSKCGITYIETDLLWNQRHTTSENILFSIWIFSHSWYCPWRAEFESLESLLSCLLHMWDGFAIR